MKAPLPLLTLLLLLGVNCANEEKEVGSCNENLLAGSENYHAMVLSLPDHVVAGLAKNPDAEGALGRNTNGYFHVRFQMDIAFLASAAVYTNSDEALQKWLLAAEYAFNRQKPEGDFELVIPSDLEYLGQPAAADLASGTSFFLSALGSSLVLLKQSPWFAARPDDDLKQRLTRLIAPFQKSLDYLKTQQEVLKTYDAEAPNRLLFNALAFYAMGAYLDDQQAKEIGRAFIDLAIAKQDAAGYYVEGGGFDSSYNGVALRLGLVLLGILEPTDAVRDRLAKSLSCGVQWQASRVLESGEISLEGNTRVYPGGETFLGSQKQIAWIESLLAFYFTYSLTGDKHYEALSKKVEAFYR